MGTNRGGSGEGWEGRVSDKVEGGGGEVYLVETCGALVVFLSGEGAEPVVSLFDVGAGAVVEGCVKGAGVSCGSLLCALVRADGGWGWGVRLTVAAELSHGIGHGGFVVLRSGLERSGGIVWAPILTAPNPIGSILRPN